MNRVESRDLVVSMTLAEIFIVLVLILWWGTALEAEGDGKVPPTVECALLRAERDALLAERDALLKERSELRSKLYESEQRLEAVRQMLGAKDTTVDELAKGLKGKEDEAREEGKRGRPRCSAANVLVHVRSLNGMTATVLPVEPAVLRSLEQLGSGRLEPGLALDDAGSINRLVAAVTKYYSRSGDCRFDYRLSYGSASDYRDARELFEVAFYPERIRRIED